MGKGLARLVSLGVSCDCYQMLAELESSGRLHGLDAQEAPSHGWQVALAQGSSVGAVNQSRAAWSVQLGSLGAVSLLTPDFLHRCKNKGLKGSTWYLGGPL